MIEPLRRELWELEFEGISQAAAESGDWETVALCELAIWWIIAYRYVCPLEPEVRHRVLRTLPANARLLIQRKVNETMVAISRTKTPMIDNAVLTSLRADSAPVRVKTDPVDDELRIADLLAWSER